MRTISDKIQEHFKNRLPFAVYSKPNSEVLTGVFQQSQTLFHVDGFNESGFIMAPFNGSNIVLIPNSQSEVMTAEFKSAEAETIQKVIAKVEFIESEQAKIQYEDLVKKAIASIEKNQFKKVVLSRTEVAAISDYDIATLFEKLLITYPAAFKYCFYHPEIGLWFGATPERLLKVSTNAFETIALAGTQKFEGIDDVIWENKEQQEQQYVTDFILENLENVTSDVAFSNPYTYKAGNLLHIKTDISGTLNNNSNIKELLEILHPTPAVCGLPKKDAQEFILKNEGYDRRYYSGFLGELNMNEASDKQTDLYVNLRCMEISEEKLHLYMGCGITKDSDPAKEFMETVNKSMTMKNILKS